MKYTTAEQLILSAVIIVIIASIELAKRTGNELFLLILPGTLIAAFIIWLIYMIREDRKFAGSTQKLKLKFNFATKRFSNQLTLAHTAISGNERRRRIRSNNSPVMKNPAGIVDGIKFGQVITDEPIMTAGVKRFLTARPLLKSDLMRLNKIIKDRQLLHFLDGGSIEPWAEPTPDQLEDINKTIIKGNQS